MWLQCALLAVMSMAGTEGTKEEPAAAQMRSRVAVFLASLSAQQRARTVIPFEDENRLDWHYVPRERRGIALKELTADQTQRALAALRAGLSQQGFRKVETIRSLEDVLRVMEQGNGPVRDPGLYYLTVFGEPSAVGAWGWRFEGHHVSLNWTILRGKVISSTPQFLGSNPAEVREGPLKGTRPLAAEEDLARALLDSLSPDQRTEAILSASAPPDILTSNLRQAAILEERGIRYAKLNKEQRGILLALLEAYASAMPRQVAEERLARLRKAGLDAIQFAWMGGSRKGEPHYYRVQGKTFLVEYDNTQNQANHIHCVWRDFAGDFGRDVLLEHYKAHSHAPGADHLGH